MHLDVAHTEEKEVANMRATVYYGPHDMRVEQVPDPTIQAPTDVIARITHACICGSDLWSYRGIDPRTPGDRMGHEWIGIIEEVGAAVRTLKKGDHVISPFTISDGTCEFCHAGLPSSCVHGMRWGGTNDGGQGEAVRVPYADGTLVALPSAVEGDAHLLNAVLPLTDVMATGHQDQRLALGQRFGATAIITARDEQAVQQVRELTQGGADAVMECVGTLDAMNMGIHMTRPGKTISLIGFTHADKAPDLTYRLFQNITISGGVAPSRAYLPELLADVLAGTLDPSPVLDMTVDLDGVPAGDAIMAQRTWFITGVSSGFGRELTEQLLQRGDRVVGTVRDTGKVGDLAERFPQLFRAEILDVTDTAAIHVVVERAFTQLGRIDVIISNAGYGLFGAAEELSNAQINQIIATNLVGPITLIRTALPHLRTQRGGRIIQISSYGGQVAFAGNSLYHATKWGIEGFVESVAQEVAPFGIGMTIVEPGGARTEFRSGSAQVADLMPVYDQTPAHSFLRMLDPQNGLAPGDPARMATRIIASVDSEPAPLRLVLGSQALESTLATLRKRIADFEAQKELAASTDFPPEA
jgi:threonine dehydrogenase-like Zn-dependent dehydrogenase/NAD(P)-dependent dehydrogenase (short-subunit alcohol dehydrogenase family)